MIITITGIQHHDLSSIADCTVPKNAVIVEREPEYDKKPADGCDGLAYRCSCKGVTIGYVPLVRTLRKYLKDATTQAGVEKATKRGVATKKVRKQLEIETDSVGTERWVTRIVTLLYVKDHQFIEFPEYSELCQRGEQEGWELCEVGIDFDNVEEF